MEGAIANFWWQKGMVERIKEYTFIYLTKYLGFKRNSPGGNVLIRLPGSLKISWLMIRGANGRVLGSRTVLNDNIPSIFVAEALALYSTSSNGTGFGFHYHGDRR
ncbi:hypothetical protein J1N35_005671 [Gossypium stocksii]|uniref:Uncharacterized protein n=1 Tax=Gossypium stocksii TaxID=47602 RepID=A0A9D4AJH2_9ROSI|nr:hypothetical protein J1N35_005671 [Gossypium stocksii]